LEIFLISHALGISYIKVC